MEKFIVVQETGDGSIRAFTETANNINEMSDMLANSALGGTILSVDEALTLAEKLVKFVAEYRKGNTCNPLQYEVRGVLQDIGTTLKTKV